MPPAAHATSPSALRPPPVDGPLSERGASDPAAPREVVDSVGGENSPILANIYLHEVLDMWFDREVKPRMSGRVQLIRYADDAVLLFSDERDAQRVMAVLPKRFGTYGLTLHPC